MRTWFGGRCCFVFGPPDIWIKWVYLYWASMLPGFCSREHMVFKKKLFKEFQDGCFMHGHLWYLNGLIWAIIQCLLFALVYAQMDICFWKKRYCLKNWRQLPLWHNTMNRSAVGPQSPVKCPTNSATVFYKYADGFLSFEQFRTITLPYSVFQTYTWPNLSILIGIVPHDSTLKHYFVEK